MKKYLTLLVLLLFANCQLLIAQDSLDIKIGQMILIGFPKAEVDKTVLEAIRQGKAGSIIFFEKNIPPKNSYIDLKKIIWTYQQAAPIPLFVTIDQEGGRVNRLKEKYGFPRSVSAAQLGKSSIDSIQFYSEITASTLAGLGFNVNFAPVVDVAINPDNPVIAKIERSYSSQADSVTIFAREFIRQHQKLGVIPVLKHFPGHGSSQTDSHLGLTDVTNTWTDRELIPYKALIDSGYVDAIMTAHIVNKNLDVTGNPGTLSAEMISKLLRGKLNFNGVVFSDDMPMHAIAKHYGLEDAIKLAIQAGVDILCFSNNIQGSQERTVDKVHGIIRNFVRQGIISEERIDESFKRIMKLKGKLEMSTEDYYRKELLRSMEQAEVMMREMRKIEELVAQKEALVNEKTEVDSKKSKRKKKN